MSYHILAPVGVRDPQRRLGIIKPFIVHDEAVVVLAGWQRHRDRPNSLSRRSTIRRPEARPSSLKEVFGKSFPYLQSVESNCELSPYAVWERKIPFGEIEKALNIRGLRNLTVKSYTATGRVKEVTVESDSGRSAVKATELRKLLGWSSLPSTNFTLRMNGGTITFEGKGYGHGVGLCQWSALQLARDGKNYKEILSFFYPGTVEVGSRFLKLGNRSIVSGYGLFIGETCHDTAECVNVFFDLDTRKPVSPPPAVRALLEAALAR